jgi:hypothetical protein
VTCVKRRPHYVTHLPGINATRARLHFKAEWLFGFIEQFQQRALAKNRARNANKWRRPSIAAGKIKTVNLLDGVFFCTDCVE